MTRKERHRKIGMMKEGDRIRVRLGKTVSRVLTARIVRIWWNLETMSVRILDDSVGFGFDDTTNVYFDEIVL